MGADRYRDRPHWDLLRGWLVHIAVGPVPHFSSPTLSDSLTVLGTMQGITAVRAASERRPGQGCPGWARLTGRRCPPRSPPGQAPTGALPRRRPARSRRPRRRPDARDPGQCRRAPRAPRRRGPERWPRRRSEKRDLTGPLAFDEEAPDGRLDRSLEQRNEFAVGGRDSNHAGPKIGSLPRPGGKFGAWAAHARNLDSKFIPTRHASPARSGRRSCTRRTPIRPIVRPAAAGVRQAVRAGQPGPSPGRAVSSTSRAIASISGS
jgi:hypothetical protein